MSEADGGAHTPERALWATWFGAVLTAGAAFVLFALTAPELAAPPIVAGVLAFVCVGVEVVLVAWRAPSAGRRALGLALPFGGLLALSALGVEPPWLSGSLVTVGLLALGTLVGGLVGGAVQHPGYLLVVAVVSSLVDAFSVLHPGGPTAQLVQIEAAVNILVLPWPILGTADIAPVLGVGDVAFAGIYMAASRRHGLSMARTGLGLGLGLGLTLGVLLVLQVAVPALPFLGAGVLLTQPRARRLPREDRRTAAIGVGVLVLLFAVAFAVR